MIRILFICHGNICRSPMAEFIMKELVRREGLEAGFHIESAAVSSEELGNPVYPPAQRVLAEHGISFTARAARRITADEYRRWDHIVCADGANVRALMRLFGGDPDGRVSRLMDHVPGRRGDVADPWYTGDFREAFDDIAEGCAALLRGLHAGPGRE